MSTDETYEDLLDKIDRLEADVTEHRETLAVLVEEQNRTAAAIEDMTSAVESLDPLQAASAGGSGVGAWAATATAEDWAALADWVDAFITRYELAGWLRPCWPLHGGVVEELAALRLSWRTATAAMRGPAEEEDLELEDAPEDEEALVWQDQETYAYWHDRILEPTKRRLHSGFYPMSACKNGHQRPPAVQLTDRSTIPSNLSTGAPVAALEETS